MVNFLKKQSFHPSIFSLFINPLYFIRSCLYKNIKKKAPLLKGKLMDFGCGRKPYEALFNVNEYIGIDVEKSGHNHKLSKVDFYYDGKTIPFQNDYFDSVFCGEVIEHIFTPDASLLEINRVLKTGGLLLLTVPFCWNEHEAPFDYARYSSYGIKSLLERNGFRVVSVNKTGSFAKVIFQLSALYFFELFKKYGRLGYAFSLFFIAPINIIGVILSLLMPVDKSLYFNNVVLAEKIDGK